MTTESTRLGALALKLTFMAGLLGLFLLSQQQLMLSLAMNAGDDTTAGWFALGLALAWAFLVLASGSMDLTLANKTNSNAGVIWSFFIALVMSGACLNALGSTVNGMPIAAIGVTALLAVYGGVRWVLKGLPGFFEIQVESPLPTDEPRIRIEALEKPGAEPH
ncbi:MAG: hypothetical protein V4644_00455 [Patescibacteria group bacterium]